METQTRATMRRKITSDTWMLKRGTTHGRDRERRESTPLVVTSIMMETQNKSNPSKLNRLTSSIWGTRKEI